MLRSCTGSMGSCDTAACHDDALLGYEDMALKYAEEHQRSPLESREANNDPKLQAYAIQTRWNNLGLLDDPGVQLWASGVEWASLGCFCGPARALQLLGLRKRAYPLDFMRSDIFGVLHLLRTGFTDFMHVEGKPFPGVVQGEMTYSTSWGGSFWHHDMNDPKVRSAIQRRVDRLLGKDPEVPQSKPRAFVVVANGSADVAHSHELHAALQKVYGPNTPVYLLTIIDNQDHEEIDDLVYTKHPSVLFFKAPSLIWRSADFNGLDTLAEEYVRGIALAMELWTMHEGGQTDIDSLRDLGDTIIPYYANSPKTHLYNVIEGQRGAAAYSKEHEADVEEAYESDEEEYDGSKCMIS